MLTPSSDEALFSIRCPTCGQRFKVDADFRERTVECGTCEHRFRIGDDVIMESRKFYPGERNNQSLQRFNRIPLSAASTGIGVQAMRYADVPPPSALEPTGPLRTLAGGVGVLGMVSIALLMMFSTKPGDLLDGMVTENRLVIVGFTGFMGTILLIYANPKARMKAVWVGLLMSGCLTSLPFIFNQGTKRKDNHETFAATAPIGIAKEVNHDSEVTILRKRIGTKPLEDEIAKLAKKGGEKYAFGLWLKNTTSSQRYLIEDYLLRVTGADEASHFYPRDNNEFLFVLTGLSIPIAQLTEILLVLGDVNSSYREIDVIEVNVNTTIFEAGSIEKLTKKTDPAFYELNKRELDSIELERVKRAVQRLADAEPKIYRTDITRKLISLLKEEGIDFKGDICSTLGIWTEKPGPASQAALELANKQIEKGLPVEREIIALIVKEKNLGVIPTLGQLWNQNPLPWESLYGDLGSAIEPNLLEGFKATRGTFRSSSIRLLGRVGTAASLPILSSELAKSDREQTVLINQAQKAITERLGK
jgi:DNA-directed RNA polymerase subunit RPC12/RpoP